MLPWYMIDLDNFQLYVSELVPEDIKDEKNVILTESPIPGLGYQPISPGGNSNRIVNFTLPIYSTEVFVGNSLLLRYFKQIRSPIAPLFQKPEQHQRSPKVLYNFGLGDPPMVFYAKNCSISSKGSMVNEFGNPELSYVDISLLYDPEHEINIIEEQYSQALSSMGSIQSLLESVNTIGGSRI